MIVLFHVVVAIVSLLMTSLAVIYPSSSKLKSSLYLILATLISGTYLVISTHQPILKSCLAGLAYLAVTITGNLITYRRLLTNINN